MPRPLVDFFIVGVQKGGTTAIDTHLRRHPSIQMASVKEVHHFDDERVNWSSPSHDRLHAQFDWSASGLVRGEATPIYIYWPRSLQRMKDYNPHARLILVLRHPAMRAYSHWRMETVRGHETFSFADAISESGRDRIKQGPYGNRVYSYVERGFYAPQIRRLLDLFPRMRVHFLRTDMLWRDPASVLSSIEQFLDVEPVLGRSVDRSYVAPVDSSKFADQPIGLSMGSRDIYDDDIRETSALTGLDLSDWLDPGYREPMASDAK